MPDQPDAAGSPDDENNTAEAPPARPGPLQNYEKPDVGCLVLLGLCFLSLLVVPAGLLLGGAPVLLPALAFFVLAALTPVINPTERMSPRARWIGRGITLLLLAGLVAASWFFWIRESGGMIRE